jgi:O-acetylserine/cysteine efflux transporter
MSLIKDKYAKYIIIIAPIAWGLNPSFMKIAYRYVSPLMMNFIRLVMAFIFFVIFTMVTKKLKLKEVKEIAMDTKMLSLIFVVFQVCYSLGIKLIPASFTGIIFGLLPVTVLIINTITGDEKASVKMLVSIAMSLVGVVIIILSGNVGGMGVVSLTGLLLVLAAQISYGLFTVESKKKVLKYNTMVMTTVIMVPTAFVFFILIFKDIATFDYGLIPVEGWVSMFFAGVVGMGIANAIWMWGTGKIGSTRISLYNNLNPVAALTGAFIMLGERMNGYQYMGVAVIFAAIILSQHQFKGNGNKVDGSKGSL